MLWTAVTIEGGEVGNTGTPLPWLPFCGIELEREYLKSILLPLNFIGAKSEPETQNSACEKCKKLEMLVIETRTFRKFADAKRIFYH